MNTGINCISHDASYYKISGLTFLLYANPPRIREHVAKPHLRGIRRVVHSRVEGEVPDERREAAVRENHVPARAGKLDELN